MFKVGNPNSFQDAFNRAVKSKERLDKASLLSFQNTYSPECFYIRHIAAYS